MPCLLIQGRTRAKSVNFNFPGHHADALGGHQQIQQNGDHAAVVTAGRDIPRFRDGPRFGTASMPLPIRRRGVITFTATAGAAS